MPGNTIALAKNYTDLLDEVYKDASYTEDLTSDPTLIRAGANANEIIYPQISVTGLGDYDRNSGYTDGSVDVKWETAKFNYDRGTKISVDTMDDEETFYIAFGQAGGTLQREKVAPEADAFTFATIAGTPGVTVKAENLTTAEAFLAALIVAKNTTGITQQRITDTRMNNELCGIVINLIDSIDTTTLFKQLQSQITENIELIQSAIDETLAGEILSKLTKDMNTLVVPKKRCVDATNIIYCKF